MSKARLTEEEKKAISLNLGHANVGTTFGSYGSGNMSSEDAVKIVQKLKTYQKENEGGHILSEEERVVLEKLISKAL